MNTKSITLYPSSSTMDVSDIDFNEFGVINAAYSKLSGIDFKSAGDNVTDPTDFRGADFGGADLRENDFEGVDLRWYNLRGANFSGAKFEWSDLSSEITRRENKELEERNWED